MNFLADESVDQDIVNRLRLAEHDIVAIAESTPGISDDEVLKLANAQEAVLLTADKDFGELVFRQRQLSTGVLLLRLAGLPAEAKSALVLSAIGEHGDELYNAFSVLSPGLLRIRRR